MPGVLTAPTVAAFSTCGHLVAPIGPESVSEPSPRAVLWFPVVIGVAHGIARCTTRVRQNTAGVANSGA